MDEADKSARKLCTDQAAKAHKRMHENLKKKKDGSWKLGMLLYTKIVILPHMSNKPGLPNALTIITVNCIVELLS